MKALHLIALALVIFVLAQCGRKTATGDTDFARSTFESLVRGDSAVSNQIDWATFTSLGTNVGALYVSMETEQDRADFINAFITQFATEFRESGGSVSNYTNWRIGFQDDTRREVLADSPKGTLKVTVTTRDSLKRVSALSLTE